MELFKDELDLVGSAQTLQEAPRGTRILSYWFSVVSTSIFKLLARLQCVITVQPPATYFTSPTRAPRVNIKFFIGLF